MKSILKHWRRWIFVLIILFLLTPFFFIRHAVNEITTPPRRPLQSYHQAILDDPSKFAIKIEKFTTSDGTPVIICTPNNTVQPNSRGAILRNQLLAEGRLLTQPREIIGTLVLVHGRRGRKEDFLPMAERFCAIGFICVIPDLPAHGDHPEKLATYGIREASLPAKILREAAIAHRFSPTPAGILGMSMGGSVAIHSMAEPSAPWSAMVILQSFDRFSPIIAAQCDLQLGNTCGPMIFRSIASGFQSRTGLPIGSIHPAKILSSSNIPTLIAHGTADRTIPITSGKHLFHSLPATTPKRWIEVPAATHENILITDYPLFAAIGGWFLDHVPISSTPAAVPPAPPANTTE